MNAIVLLVVIFLFNGESQAGAKTFASAEECKAAGEAITAAANDDSAVRFAGFNCVIVRGGDKS